MARRVADMDVLIKRTAEPLFIASASSTFAPMCGDNTKRSLPNYWYGYGELDVYRAVAECLEEEQKAATTFY